MHNPFTIQLALALCSTAFCAGAMSPQDLQKIVAAGEPITIIDLRSEALFQEGHLPNAINIPAVLVPQKNLPPLGRVVVYDDGLGQEAAKTAAAALNRMNGIQAEVLDGGLAGWEQSAAYTTAAAGLSPESTPVITYDRLKRTSPEEVVLVDLRRSSAAPGQSRQVAGDPAPLSDLTAEFPNIPIIKSPFTSPPARRQSGSAGTVPPLLVLIDNGDGAAQESARALKANGVKRFAILAGGEEIIARKGRPGLQRVGTTFTVQQPKAPESGDPNR